MKINFRNFISVICLLLFTCHAFAMPCPDANEIKTKVQFVQALPVNDEGWVVISNPFLINGASWNVKWLRYGRAEDENEAVRKAQKHIKTESFGIGMPRNINNQFVCSYPYEEYPHNIYNLSAFLLSE